jgi:cytoskeleton protein RodZ
MAAPRGPRDFGGTLRAARERRGLSLRQIASATKISMITLEALERNDLARLPGGIFSRAFVRSYALEVGLDPETAIQEFMAQFPQDSVTAGHPITSQLEDHEAVESDRRAASTLVRLVAISVPIAAVVLYFGMLGRPASPRPEPRSEAAAVPPKIAPPPAAQPTPAPAPVDDTPAAAPAAAAVPAVRLIVQVLATKTSWISAIVDGRRAVQRMFQAGEEQTFEVHKEIVLSTGDAGGVAVMFNGAPAKPLGASGQVVTTRINLTNFKDYLLAP